MAGNKFYFHIIYSPGYQVKKPFILKCNDNGDSLRAEQSFKVRQLTIGHDHLLLMVVLTNPRGACARFALPLHQSHDSPSMALF